MNEHFYKLLGSDLIDYQTQILNYFNKSSNTVLLLYLTVGCGKTLTSLACSISALEQKKVDEIIILSPKSVQDEFDQNFKLLETFRNINKAYGNKIKLVAYNANNSQKSFEKIIDTNKKYLLIIDELHLFMRGVIKVNLEQDQKIRNVGNCQTIFDIIKSLKFKKVIGLTGTPSAKFPFEMIPFFNLNSSNPLFPENIDEFEKMYINKSSHKLKNVAKLKKNLKGLIAFKELKTDLKATPLQEIEVEMSENMYKKYLMDYYLELQETTFIKHRNIYGIGYGMTSTFHAKTFQDSIYYNDDVLSKKEINNNLNLALRGTLEKFKYDSKIKEIKVNNEHCPKLLKMYKDTIKIKGLCVFYFKFVDYGVNVMEEILKKHGYEKYERSDIKESEKDDKNKQQNKHSELKPTFVTFTGNETAEQKAKIKKIFNSYENRHGEIIKYMILSSCGAVGITLKNVRYLGIGCVEFNYSAIRQIMGRVNRFNSHKDLKPSERTLEQKIYLSVKNEKYYKSNIAEINKLCSRTTYGYEDKKALCIERIIYQDSIYDDKINEEFRDVLKSVSVI